MATLEYDLYADCANKVNRNRQKQIVIKMSSILHNCDWKSIVGYDIDMNDYVYMGAPFITNCKKWKDVYNTTVKIIKQHTNTENGIYKLFTMSLQNIIFYNRIGNINSIIKVIQDLGSDRKHWEKQDLFDKAIVDWSGVYKPWFSNGLYKELWLYYDIMNLSCGYGEVHKNKNIIESFN